MTEFFRRHAFAVFLAMVCFLVLYAVPVFGEYALLRLHVGTFLCCVVLSDLPGAVVLYALGFRRSAIVVYLAASILETLFFLNGMSPGKLIWLTNVVPAIAAAVSVFALNDFQTKFEE